MDSLLGLLLSLSLMFPVLILGIDLYGLQNVMVYLQTKATTISYQISKEGGIRTALIAALEDESITLTCHGVCQNVSIGEVITYDLLMYYTPLLISNEPITLVVTRSIMIGYL